MENDDEKRIEELLKAYLDAEMPTQNRLEETTVLAKIGEAIEILEKSIQPIRDGLSFSDLTIRSEVFDAINKVGEILYEIDLLLMAKHHDKPMQR